MTANEVQDLVNDFIAKLYRQRLAHPKGQSSDFKYEAINWADLRCVEAREFKDGSWYVLIEEAGPGHCPQFCTEVETRLRQRGIKAIVNTEW